MKQIKGIKKIVVCSILLLQNANLWSQNMVSKKLETAVDLLLKTRSMQQSILGFTVLDAQTGNMVYSKNANIGLPMASTQKTIIAIASLEKLNPEYTYTTTFESEIMGDTLMLNIIASGDPSLASYIFADADRNVLMQNIAQSFKNCKNIKCVKYAITKTVMDSATCRAWTWEDMGNGYGASVQNFNWRENLVDVFLDGENRVGGKTNIVSTMPLNTGFFSNSCVTDVVGSGDETNVYRAPNSKQSFIVGTIPAQSKNFEIQASLNGSLIFESEFANYLKDNNFVNSKPVFVEVNNMFDLKFSSKYKYTSPNLDSLLKRYLRKSINIYGESFIKTLGKKMYGEGNYETGIQVINDMTKSLKIDSHAVHIFDGSGLSPQNRITTKAMCSYLMFAKNAKWSKCFYNALPIINGLSMKSGNIHQTAAYTGYANSSSGKQYIFAIVAQNYDGSGREMREKLWKVLDVLK